MGRIRCPPPAIDRLFARLIRTAALPGPSPASIGVVMADRSTEAYRPARDKQVQKLHSKRLHGDDFITIFERGFQKPLFTGAYDTKSWPTDLPEFESPMHLSLTTNRVSNDSELSQHRPHSHPALLLRCDLQAQCVRLRFPIRAYSPAASTKNQG
jgi:hypothetical protein